MLVRPTNRPGNDATLDASSRIRDADSAVHPAATLRVAPNLCNHG